MNHERTGREQSLPVFLTKQNLRFDRALLPEILRSSRSRQEVMADIEGDYETMRSFYRLEWEYQKASQGLK